MQNILVTIDFNKELQRYMQRALTFIQPLNAHVKLIHIAAPDPDFVSYEAGPQSVRDIRAEDLRDEHKLLQKMAAAWKAKGIDAEALLVSGPTIETIVKTSEQLKIDLIVMGHIEHNFLYKAFFGSHSKQIIGESEIPILVIPL